MKLKATPYKMINHIQNYEWGTKGKHAFIPNFLGYEGEEIPYAELWIGAHPKLSSEIIVDDVKIQINDLLDTYPEELLGKNVLNKFGNQIPFLLKVLSANKALSIQTHPNKKQAIELHHNNPENYPDDNHKPEIAVALDNLIALVGFRKFNEIEKNLINYKQFSEFIGLEEVERFIENKNTSNLKRLFSELMNKSSNNDELQKIITNFNNLFETKTHLSEDEALFLTLHKQYGADVGLLVLFFLNVVKLNAGEGIFTPAGIPHAYLKGNIVECMANSDNVVRAGLTPKFKDVNKLIDILTYQAGEIDLVGKKQSERIYEYHVNVEEFILDKIKLGNDLLNYKTNNSVEVILVSEGKLNCNNVEIKKGESVLLPALLNNVCIEGNGSFFRVRVPQ